MRLAMTWHTDLPEQESLEQYQQECLSQWYSELVYQKWQVQAAWAQVAQALPNAHQAL